MSALQNAESLFLQGAGVAARSRLTARAFRLHPTPMHTVYCAASSTCMEGPRKLSAAAWRRRRLLHLVAIATRWYRTAAMGPLEFHKR